MKPEHGDLVAGVIWQYIVGKAVADASPGQTVRFMLAGLSKEVLEGVARDYSNSVHGRSQLLRMSPYAAPDLDVDASFLSDESAVHWRHSEEADVIVFAPSDEEREAIGSSLGPLWRIDESRIVEQIHAWREMLNETDAADEYLRAALHGLCDSRVYLNLRMWVEFVAEIRDMGFGRPVDTRIKLAIPALGIPIYGIPKLPTFSNHGNPKATATNFAAAFRDAKYVAGGYAELMTPRHERVDVEEVRAKVDEFPHEDDPEILDALNVVRDFLNDADNIRPGFWRDSQEAFCRKVSWQRIGSRLFESRRRAPSLKLGESTLRYIKGNYESDVTQEDRDLLNSLSDVAPRDPREEEVAFFDRWEERLASEQRLFKSWQKRLYSKEVLGNDLLSAFAEGFEALMIAAGTEALVEMDDPGILVRASQHEKALFWERMDREVQRLFRFELRNVYSVFGDRVCWDLDYAFRHDAKNSKSSSQSRKIELVMYLLEKRELLEHQKMRHPPPSATRVKTIWQPGRSPKDEPASLSLVDDIQALNEAAKVDSSKGGLFRALKFAPRPASDGSYAELIKLADRNSFSDVSHGQEGRTFDIFQKPDDNLLGEIRTKLDELGKTTALEKDVSKRAQEAISTFEGKFHEAIAVLAEDSIGGFASSVIDEQANAFGELCRACRLPATAGHKGKEIRSLVARIGFVSSGPDQPMAILAPWHPLRLAERLAKTRELADFVNDVLSSAQARETDLSVAFDERRKARSRWVFPEVAIIDGNLLVSVEDLSGYSLMSCAERFASSHETLEASVPEAAVKFMEGVDRYLEIHPHEVANLSVAIFDSESRTLPGSIASELAKRLHQRPELRCDLVITHGDQESMRNIYHSQNVRLETENISETARGFLSRLRMDVRPNKAISEGKGVAPDLDLVFLHDVISRHATPAWEVEKGGSESLSESFDTSITRRTRHRYAEADVAGVGVFLSLQSPPRAVAEYQDLLYELSNGFLPDGFRGVLVRQVRFDDEKVQDVIGRAHRLAEWVITYDQVASRSLLKSCGVEIISDVSTPGSDRRVIISSGKVSDRMKRNLQENISKSCEIDMNDSSGMADAVIDDVLGMSGQKALSAARYSNASREMIGLAVMRAWMEAALKADWETPPLWISLDDYRGSFLPQGGRIADAIALGIGQTDEQYQVSMLVGEAKFVERSSLNDTKKYAQQQVRDTVDRLIRFFADNNEEITRATWCSRLSELLANREGVGGLLADASHRDAFFSALNSGDVAFRIAGETVVCLHDEHGDVTGSDRNPDRPHLRCHILATPEIRRTLQHRADGELPEWDGIGDVQWYEGSPYGPYSGPQSGNSSGPDSPTSTKVDGNSSDSDGDNSENKTLPRPPVRKVSDDEDDIASSKETASDNMVDIGKDAKPRYMPRPFYEALRKLATKEVGAINDAESLDWAEKTSIDLQRAFGHFSMHAQFAEPKLRLTPNGALIAFCGHSSLTVNQVEKKKGELLTTYGIDVADVRPGRGEIAIFVKREKRANVPLASTWLSASWPDSDPGICTNLIIGAREDVDRLLYLNLAGSFAGYEQHGPHTLIAGETGSGKGVLTQGILLQLIAFNNPSEAELVLVDPKQGVDFGWLEGAPHMNSDIVTDIDESRRILETLVQEMDERYKLLKSAGVANISDFNSGKPIGERMSRIFLVHDELGAWMAQEREYQEVILSSVSNLGMKARAAGIHLILITQKADAEAVPTKLRDNMGNRLCLRVQSSTGSRMVLGVGGAEKLLGKGHLACVLANEPNPLGQEYFVVQTPFAKMEDISRLAQAAKEFWSSGNS